MLAGCWSSGTSSAVLQSAMTQSRAHPASGTYGYCPPLSGGTGILADGDFSQAEQPGPHGETFFHGQIFAPSWEVTKRAVDLYASDYGYGIDGLCSIDLDGSLVRNPLGGIRSDGFKTTKGQTYILRFLFSGNGYCTPTVKTMKVSVPKLFTQYTWDTSGGNDVQNGDYSPETWNFKAAHTITQITFTSEDPKGSFCGPMVAGLALARK